MRRSVIVNGLSQLAVLRRRLLVWSGSARHFRVVVVLVCSEFDVHLGRAPVVVVRSPKRLPRCVASRRRADVYRVEVDLDGRCLVVVPFRLALVLAVRRVR